MVGKYPIRGNRQMLAAFCRLSTFADRSRIGTKALAKWIICEFCCRNARGARKENATARAFGKKSKNPGTHSPPIRGCRCTVASKLQARSKSPKDIHSARAGDPAQEQTRL